MKLTLPKLYPIADIATLTAQGVSLAVFAAQVVAGGGQILQLRDKIGSPQEILRHAAVLTEVLLGTNCLPVMNDRADLAQLAGWHAIHVGHLDMPAEAVRRVFGVAGEDVIVGVSTHTAEQVIAADAGSADYIAVGPVFATGTKVDAEPVIGLAGVRRARRLTKKPMVAIGGITRANAVSVLEAGADSVAVIGAFFTRDETVEAVLRDFLGRLR